MPRIFERQRDADADGDGEGMRVELGTQSCPVTTNKSFTSESRFVCSINKGKQRIVYKITTNFAYTTLDSLLEHHTTLVLDSSLSFHMAFYFSIFKLNKNYIYYYY